MVINVSCDDLLYYLIVAPRDMLIRGVNINRANIGSTSRIVCIAIASPPPIFGWQKDGQPYYGPADVGNGTLIFTSVKKEDGGIYRCTASNVVGEASTTTSFTVYGMY